MIAAGGSDGNIPPLPLVTPAGAGRPSDGVLSAMGKVFELARYRVGDGAAADVAARLTAAFGEGDGWAAITFRSGTDALLRALGAVGVGPGARVAIPDLAFEAVGGAVLMLGATPVPVDIDDGDWNLDPIALEAAIAASRVDAVVAVDNYGTRCDRQALGEVCRRAEIPLVLDACESLGAATPDRLAGSVDAVVVSFSFTKPIHAAGAGGALVAGLSLVDAVRTSPRFMARHAQLPELNATYLLDTWNEIEGNVERLRAQYQRYQDFLVPLGFRAQSATRGSSRIHAPFLVPGRQGARDSLVSHLAAAGIEARAMFASQTRLFELGRVPSVSATVADRVVCLPTGAGLDGTSAIERVAHAVCAWAGEQRRR